MPKKRFISATIVALPLEGLSSVDEYCIPVHAHFNPLCAVVPVQIM